MTPITLPVTLTIEEQDLDRAIERKRTKTGRFSVDDTYVPSCHCVTAQALMRAGVLPPDNDTRQIAGGWGRDTGTLPDGRDIGIQDTAHMTAVHRLTTDFDDDEYVACRAALPLTVTLVDLGTAR